MIKSVQYIKDYKLRVGFDDGLTKNIDLYPFMSESKHPLVRKFLNKKRFKEVKIESGALAWGDNEFDINPANIYKGKYDCENF